MILKVYASDRRFKVVEFHSGLNIILAERSDNSSEKDTRNGAGKTTLISVIHFCLGADIKKLALPYADIENWSFFIDLTVCGKLVNAKRSVKKPNIIVVSGDVDDLPITAMKDESSGEYFYKNDDWKRLLGIAFFGLKDDFAPKYKPSFRSLISYFARRGVDAYSRPFSHFRNQNSFDIQINNAFLLGLNWKHASEAQEIQDSVSVLKALKAAVTAGMVSSQGELEADRVRLEKNIADDTKAISNFKVLPQYKELQDRTNSLTTSIHKYSNKLLVARRKLSLYEESVEAELPSGQHSVESLYAEAGFVLPELIKKTLVEAKAFHAAVVKNRKKFLETEITETKHYITNLENEIEAFSRERASLLQLLQTHGALDEFHFLQKKLVEKLEQLESIKTKLQELRDFSKKQQEIKERKLELDKKLRRDYDTCRPHWEKAVDLFNESSMALYDSPGNLIINTTDRGYTFDVEIPRSGSEGIGRMKIFCYDMMLVELSTEKKGIDFLIHDSTLFDAVDSRQRAHAIEYAYKRSKDHHFQYICTINSDMVPYDDFKEDFNFNDFIRLTLGDEKPASSLMGFHFELGNESKSSPE